MTPAVFAGRTSEYGTQAHCTAGNKQGGAHKNSTLHSLTVLVTIDFESKPRFGHHDTAFTRHQKVMADNQKGSLGIIGRVVANVRFVLNYGKEDRNDPNFSWLVIRLFQSLKLMIDAI